MKPKLTALAVHKLRPGPTRREVPDVGTVGLRLVIQPTGHKSWAMRFERPTGKRVKLTLGPVADEGMETGEPTIGVPLTLAGARALAAKINFERASGADVVGERQRVKLELQARGRATFPQAALDYINQHAKRHTRDWPETTRYLGFDDETLQPIKKGLAARWADIPIADITADDVHHMVEEARERGIPGLERRTDGPSDPRARKLRQTLSGLFSWLREKRRINHNPLEGVAKVKPSKARARVLSDDELVQLWQVLDNDNNKINESFRSFVKVLALTGQRLNEVSGMRRSEIHGTEWVIPETRTKNKREHVVPLSEWVQRLLPEGKHDLIFTTTGTTPISGWSKFKDRLDKLLPDLPDWRFHDLRRSAVTGMAKLRVAPHIIEAVINHVSGSKAGIHGTYNRATYLEEKQMALQLWADHLAGLIEGRTSKVVPLRK
jgi:integrase